jgi:anti-sigma factor RsiW
MSWSCEQIEARLSDYLDGAMGPASRSEFDAHVKGCERCAPLVAELSHLLTKLHTMEQIEPPPRLVYNILDKTLGPRETATGWRAVLGWLRATGSLRFAYGALSMAATLLILVTAVGFNWHKPRFADLRPDVLYRNANREAHLVYGRGTKFVNDLRVVSEIQSRLREERDLQTTPESTIPQSSPDKQPGRTDGSQPSSPKQQNRANEIARPLEMLAEEMPLLAAPWMGGAIDSRRTP